MKIFYFSISSLSARHELQYHAQKSWCFKDVGIQDLSVQASFEDVSQDVQIESGNLRRSEEWTTIQKIECYTNDKCQYTELTRTEFVKNKVYVLILTVIEWDRTTTRNRISSKKIHILMRFSPFDKKSDEYVIYVSYVDVSLTLVIGKDSYRSHENTLIHARTFFVFTTSSFSYEHVSISLYDSWQCQNRCLWNIQYHLI